MKPTNYEEWKHCITVSCGIPLTSDYIEQRLIVLKTPKDYQTRKFKRTWGEDHLKDVIVWFEKAREEFAP